MSMIPRCITCDSKVDPWSADVQCARCSEPCRVCGKDVSLCTHPLIPFERVSWAIGDDQRSASFAA
jgi:hypothetical protein